MTGSTFLRLVRDLTQPLPQAVWPEGVALVPFSATLAPAAHRLMLRTYDGATGTVPADFDTWWAATRHDAEFDARLCFTAAENGTPAGFCLCWTSSFIKDLVVDPDHQRRGIGAALLSTALWELHRRGHREAALKVRIGNGPGLALYTAMGFVDHGTAPAIV